MMPELEEFRKRKDEFFGSHPQSPLSEEHKKVFTGLNYFPENEALRFELEMERYMSPQRVQMQTSKGDVRDFIKVGQIQFPVNGVETTLQIYESEGDEGEYFLPFVDATAPEETYSSGRYLEPERVGMDTLLV